jgi:hypothetical protein
MFASMEPPKPPIRYHGRAILTTLTIFALGIATANSLLGQPVTLWTLGEVLGCSVFVLALMYVKWWREGRLK